MGSEILDRGGLGSSRLEQPRAVIVRRQILAPGEATPWHVDPYRRYSVVVRGDTLSIEFATNAGTTIHQIAVHPGLTGWDEPTFVRHRAINTGHSEYEEVVLFFVQNEQDDPQPESSA